MIPNKKNLNPMAVARAKQNQLDRAAEDKPPETCSKCGGIIFVAAHELRIIPGLEVGAPQDVLCSHNQRFVCVACTTTWAGREEDVKDPGNRGEGQESGTGDAGGNGGAIA